MDKVYELYETTNDLNNETYIGQHSYLKGQCTDNYIGSGTGLKADIKLYGKEHFHKKTIVNDVRTQDTTNQLEKLLIKAGRENGRCGYNRANGGQGDRSNVFNKRPVIADFTGELFESVNEAALAFRLTTGKNIETVAKKRYSWRPTCAGTTWTYYTGQKEYDDNSIAINYRKHCVPVFSYWTGRFYDSIMEASSAEQMLCSDIMKSADNCGSLVLDHRYVYNKAFTFKEHWERYCNIDWDLYKKEKNERDEKERERMLANRVHSKFRFGNISSVA